MLESLVICIPVYPPHYEYAYTFIRKTKGLFHLCFIFSSNEDYELFALKDDIIPLIYPEPIPNGDDSIINKKKLYALHALKDSSYTYILVIDAETDFLGESYNETKFLHSLEAYFSNQKIYGKTITENPHYKQLRKIMETCADSFPPDVLNNIVEETDRFTVYTWWSDLPLYKREHLSHFLSLLQPPITWFHFDYILYSYYLIAYQNFKIVNVEPFIQDRTLIFEDYFPTKESSILDLHAAGVPYLYVRSSLFAKFPSLFKQLGSLFLFHMNR